MTLKLTVTNHKNLIYSTKLDFESNAEGIIDLSKDVPIYKTYISPDLMAIFWLLKPEENSDTRFWPTNLHKPLECTYEIFDRDRGKVAEDRSALFASRGFASLALSFFGTSPGLPKRYSE